MRVQLTKREFTQVLLAPKTNFKRQPKIKEAISYMGNGIYEVNNDLLLDKRSKDQLEAIIGRKLIPLY